jgi:uncharacterized membrane protein
MDQPPATSTPAPNTPATNAHQNETLMGILAYLSILVFVPLLMAKDDPFVKFHVGQGLVLFIIGAAMWILTRFLWQFFFIFQLVNLGVFVLAIIGIVNVVNHKQAELPLVGSFAKNLNFF